MRKLDEVKTKVRDEVLKQKAIDAARQKAASLSAGLKSGDFEKAAKAAGLDVKTTELITRGAPMGDAGVSPALEAAAFALPQGGVSDPVVTETGATILKVVERKDVVADELAKQKDSLRNELLNERRNKFFAAYMTKARQRMKELMDRSSLMVLVSHSLTTIEQVSNKVLWMDQGEARIVDRQHVERIKAQQQTDRANHPGRDCTRRGKFEDQAVDADQHENEGDVGIGDHP